ncbi:MAG: ImmA/IrrE family metallo-endopeptidase [Deltaproteobacteria bacterium]|nr:ImmA/IrrE family metallo-endopeptidase [Deltaproteobacteria bacterium]
MTLFGNKREFAIEILPLSCGPSDGDKAAQATWVSWSLWGQGKNLTLNTRLSDDEISTTVNWPAIYLARWFARSWPSLFYSSRWPRPSRARNARELAIELRRALLDEDDDKLGDCLADTLDDFVSTHDLRAGAAGAAYPEVWFSRDGHHVTIAWFPFKVGDHFFCQECGQVELPADVLASVVYSFGEWTRDQLLTVKDRAVESDVTLLTDWLAERKSATSAKRNLLGNAGLKPEDCEQLIKDVGVASLEELFDLPTDWVQLGESFPVMNSNVAVAFRTASPELTAADRATIWKAVTAGGQDIRASNALRKLRSGLPGLIESGAADYSQGYALAIQLREYLDNRDACLEIEVLLSDELGIPIRELKLADPAVEGGSVYDPNSRGPGVFVNPTAVASSTAWGRRMTLAHELCHLLFDLPSWGAFHLTGIWSFPHIERRANAFAAELLLPKAGIVKELGFAPKTPPMEEKFAQLMKTFQVGQITATRHVINRFHLVE